MYTITVVTGLFMLPLVLLFYIQGKNFWTNRTTNERFSSKKKVTPQVPERLSIASEDSTGSSLLAVINKLKAAEDIL